MESPPRGEYVRPTWSTQTYRDDQGAVIEYGNRWFGQVPDLAYTTISNSNRFAPLHRVSQALIEHLVATYKIRVLEGTWLAQDLGPPPPDFYRVVRLESKTPGGESMTFVFSTFPGVVLYAGSGVDAFPACGCDACDDSVERVVELLEQRVLALADRVLGWHPRR